MSLDEYKIWGGHNWYSETALPLRHELDKKEKAVRFLSNLIRKNTDLSPTRFSGSMIRGVPNINNVGYVVEWDDRYDSPLPKQVLGLKYSDKPSYSQKRELWQMGKRRALHKATTLRIRFYDSTSYFGLGSHKERERQMLIAVLKTLNKFGIRYKVNRGDIIYVLYSNLEKFL